ncbi:MAG TPA: hypothetical protein VEG37_11555 [Burkholderiales bacterium]|nr:hypothetical protein [Burkholderiales bacterium]
MKNPSVQVVIALVYFSLTLAGVAGLAYKLFEPDGWVSHGLGYVWTLELHYSLMAVPVIIAAALLGIKVFTGFFDAKSSTLGNWLTGACMVLGAYFILRLIFHGSL